jgi:uncharacterized metal-binding protein YceD (DUF177 family)
MTTEGSFSRPVKVDALPRDGSMQAVEATPAERAAIAEQQGLVDVARLNATFLVKRAGKVVRVTGVVHAEVTQTCVVTLEPFPVTLDEPVDVRYARPAEERSGRRSESETLALDAEDPPDPIVDGRVDLGALAVEFLALALDPHPRKPGAEFTPPPEETPPESPFVVLAEIAKKKG